MFEKLSDKINRLLSSLPLCSNNKQAAGNIAVSGKEKLVRYLIMYIFIKIFQV